MHKDKILLASPHMSSEGFEKKFINQAFESNWIAPLGENVDKFEEELAAYVNSKYATSLNSGTSAIHMALKASDVKENDIVFCSSLTFAASVNPIIYENALPVFIDSEYETYNMSPKALEKAFTIYPHPKAVIAVHLYGNPAKIDEISEICKKHNVTLIEDSAESLGSTYNNKQTGTFGKYGIFSFNGNKIITTSGGGMLVSDDLEKIHKVKFWATQAKDPAPYYQHSEIGYNYRMSNILAGIGRGQLKVINKRIIKKTEIYEMYKKDLESIKGINMQPSLPNSKPNHWLSVMTFDSSLKISPLDVIKKLSDENIESRAIWKPMHLQPVFDKYDFVTEQDNKLNSSTHLHSVSEDLFNRGICLPSDTKMTIEQQKEVINSLKLIISRL